MKSKRLLLSIVSVILLATGFARAAESVDLMATDAPVRADPAESSAPICALPCVTPL